MLDQKTNVPQRFIGLDVHKHYLIALGVDAELRVVLPAQRVEFTRLENWMNKTLTPQDAVVLEMTTNTWQLYDELTPRVHSVTVVHPPDVALITRSQVTPSIENKKRGTLCVQEPNMDQNVLRRIPHDKL